MSAAALSASSSTVGVITVLPKTEPIISISSVPAGNSILRVRLVEVFSVSEKFGSSPSAKIIKSSSNPSKVESKKVRSNVISNVPVEPVTSTVKIKEIKSVSASMLDTVIPVTS